MKLFESVINNIFLGFGFATLLYVLSYYMFEANYDSWVDNSKYIYRLDNIVRFQDQPAKHDPSVPLIINDSLKKNIRGILRSGIYSESWLEYEIGNQPFEVKLSLVNDDFLELFGVSASSGDTSKLFSKRNTIIITKSLSEKVFGGGEVVGRTIRSTSNKIFEVVAVIDNWPDNSHLDVEALVDYHPYLLENDPKALSSFGRSGGNIYVEVEENVTPESLETEINNYFQHAGPREYFSPGFGHDYFPVFTLTMTPLIDAHKYTYAKALEANSNKEAFLLMLLLITISIVLISVVNFLIYNNNQTIKYLYETSLLLTLGSSLKGLFFRVFSRSCKYALIICAVAIFLYFMLSKLFSVFIGLINQQSLSTYLASVLVGTLLIIALVASLLFILKVRNKSPKQIEEATFITGGARKFGLFYITLQICITCFLICMSFTMHIQLSNMLGHGKGYITEDIMVLWDFNGSQSQPSLERIEKLLSGSLGVENVALSGFVPGDNRDSSMSLREPNSNKILTMERMNIGVGTLQLLGIDAIAGRLFEHDRGDEVTNELESPISIVINEKAVKALGYKVPTQVIGVIVDQLIGGNGNWRKARVIGVVPDYNFKSAFKNIPATVYYAQAGSYDRLVIKTSDFDETFDMVQSLWLELNPKSFFDLEPLDEYLKSLYELENRQLKLILFVALFGLVMSGLGIFNSLRQTFVESQFEINMRKSLGASWLNIFRIFVFRNFPFLTIGIIWAMPAYWLAANSWLSKFTTIYSSMLLTMLVGISVVMLTVLLIFGCFIPDLRKLNVSIIKDLN